MWWYTWESQGYPTYVLHRTVGQDRHIGLACEWYTWESLGYPTYVLHRTVGQDRHIGLACEWYTWESLGYPTYVLHRTVGQDRHIGLTCVMVHMGVPGISHGTHGSPWDILPPSYIGQWDRIDT